MSRTRSASTRRRRWTKDPDEHAWISPPPGELPSAIRPGARFMTQKFVIEPGNHRVRDQEPGKIATFAFCVTYGEPRCVGPTTTATALIRPSPAMIVGARRSALDGATGA